MGRIVHIDVTNRRSVCVVTLVVLVSVTAIASGGLVAGASGGPDGSAGSIGIEALQEEMDPDDVLLAIDLEDDGDAVWTIEYRTRLDTEDEQNAFDDLQTDIEADPEAYTATFHDRMNATADDAANATGREMTISEMTVRAEQTELPREYGVVTYTFRWSNFAAVTDDDRMIVGDAIDGLFLDDASALRISWSDEWDLTEATPPPTEIRNESVVWQGPTSFAGGEPRVTLDRATGSGTGGPVEDGGTNGEEAPSDDETASDGAVSATTLALLFVLVAVTIAVGAARRGWIPPIGPIGATEPDEAGVESDDATDRPEADADEQDGTTEEGAAEGDDGPFGAGVDPELLSNEEKVLRLIEANGGRMKQKRVAEELDWTAAKTSQVTKRLREDGDLKGFRLGRENVLALPEEDPR